MRITLVTMQLGEAYVHGTERYVGSLGEALRRRGHAVQTVAGDPRGVGHRMALGTVRDAERALFGVPTRGWAAVQGASPRAFGRWLRRQGSELVHVASLAHLGLAPVLAARRLGIPVVATAMDFWWACPRGTLLRDGREGCSGAPGWRDCLACVLHDHPRPWLRGLSSRSRAGAPAQAALLALSALGRRGSPAEALRWTRRSQLLGSAFARLDHVIFPSPATRQVLGGAIARERQSEIPYGLEPEWFADPRPAPAEPRPPDSLVYGFAGSLQAHKGAHLLLEALHGLGWKRTPVRIAGTADDPAYLEHLRRIGAGLQVDWAGPQSPDQMRRFLRSLDVLVVPSRWAENLPFVLLEAQAAGLPVVGSDVPGIAHRIPDHRWLFRPGSAEDLGRALRELALGPGLPAPPPPSTVDEMVEATLSVYERVREERQRR